MNAKILFSICIPLIIFAGSVFVPTTHSHDEIHLHAGFALYRDGQKVDLADWQYMKEMPCSVESHEVLTAAEEQLEKAHLHDLVGDVVHVHRAHATWGDLFTNIGITFTKPVTGYTSAGTVTDILSQEIIPYERVIIAEGELADVTTKLAEVPTEEQIRGVEQSSESCGVS